MATASSKTTINITSAAALDTVICHIAEATNGPLGTFFVLLKIDDIEALVSWADPFASFLEDAYYRSAGTEPAITIERALAITRQKARQKLQQLIAETRTIAVSDVHYCLGALRHHDLLITHVGDIKAYLLHNARGSAASVPRYRWIDITSTPESAQPKKRGKAAQTTEASVVSGTIQARDTVFITTESIPDAMGLEKLNQIIGQTSIEGARTLIERQLRTVGGRVSYSALLLRPTTFAPVPRVGTPAVSQAHEGEVTSSMHSLRSQEDQTMALLDPEANSTTKRIWQQVSNVWKRKSYNNRTKTNPTNQGIAKTLSMGERVGQLLRGWINKGISLFIFIILIPVRLIKSAREFRSRQKLQRLLRISSEKFIENTVERLKLLPNSSRRLLLIALVFAFLFAQTLVFLADRQTKEAIVAGQTQTITNIQDRLDKAESSLIFSNDAKAARLIAEAGALLSSLSQNTNSQKERWQLLSDTINDIRSRLERVKEVSDAVQVADLTSVNFVSPNGIHLVDNDFIIHKSANNTFAKLNVKNDELEILPVTSANIARIVSGSVDDRGRLAFLTESESIATLNLINNTLEEKLIQNPPSKISNMAFYRGRLYLLTPDNNQIKRYQGLSATYGRASPWVNGSVPELANSRDLFIDGNIYVLTSDGTILKFFSGVLDDTWNASTPSIKNTITTSLLSTPNSSYLYAFNAANGRIIMWEKETGKLLNQFSFPSVPKIIDFAVDDGEQFFYLLTDAKIYKAPIVKR